MLLSFLSLQLSCIVSALLFAENFGVEIITEVVVSNSIEDIVNDGNYTAIINTPSIAYHANLTLQIDPPGGAFYPTSIGLYVRASDPNAIIFYSFDGSLPNVTCPTATYYSPYIEIDSIAVTGILVAAQLRNRTITIVAVSQIDQYLIR